MTIASYINDDLRARIQARAELPPRLTLAGLSEFYRVSMMPVRQAVSELVEAGYLQREENGRLTVNERRQGKGKGGAFQQQAPPTDWQQVIADEVVGLSLRGQAVPLVIAEVAERHGIGRTTVHGIFHRLAGVGILDHTPRCGWRVRPFRQEDLDAYLLIREMLERKALELAAPHLVAADLEALLQRNRPAAGGSPAQLDNSLHRYWVDRAGNRYIQDFFERHGAYYTVLYAHAVRGPALIATLAGQHRAILEHLLNQQLSQAQAALAVDIQSLRAILRQAIQRLEAGAASGD